MIDWIRSELLADGRGVLVEPGSTPALAAAITAASRRTGAVAWA